LTQAVDSFKSKKKFTGAITINGGGSGQGLIDLASGAVDIGCSDISPAQAGREEAGLVDHQVAIVAVGIVVSSDVAANIKEISVSDLKGIYTGTITDWKEVAGWKGTSLPIAVFYHRLGSGTRVIFETYGIMTPLASEKIAPLKNFTEIQSAVNLQKAMETGKGAIGYAAYPYCSKLTLLKIDGIELTYENVYSGKYKLWGCEHLYTKGEPTGAVKAFIEFITSKDFEKTVTENGYGLISEMKVSR
jgi:phosphate transport system substrate-binding protein